MRIRAGDTRDLPAVMAMFDEAVAWMVAHGNTQQWGTEPWSGDPVRLRRVTEMIDVGELWIAEVDGVPAGLLLTTPEPTKYVEPVAEPELYVSLLLTSRRYAGRKIGAQLLAKARADAEAKGVSLLRVDCYAGGTGELVRYYERNGFVRAGTFTVGEWPGQILEQRW
jgi:GNAT superfamily N-acetyltransferase